MSSKRARTPPISDSRTPSPEPTPKAIRTASLHGSDAAPGSEPLLCTLPPTCNPPNRPTPLANSTELEKHYAKYHAHVCEERGCGCVFPEERLLALVSGPICGSPITTSSVIAHLM